MAIAVFTITAVFTNQKAVRALKESIELVLDASADQPWNTELKNASRRLKYAAKHIRLKAGRKK